ncbi:MAG: dTDP-glucose 4,6-dehydratase [Alphaproteobacteria bacterium]|nr:dTDP-glucose 4,6-dehydratase [Alphaproteobacteria bacterium]
MILVTGGAGFIGSNFIRDWLASEFGNESIVNLDKLTYAGNLRNLADIARDPRHIFIRGDIGDLQLVSAIFAEHRPRAVVNFAAESHVDRSIVSANEFIQTNIVGTVNLLQCARAYWDVLPPAGEGGVSQATFRFLHVSTDEVYGSLRGDDPRFSECDPYQPNSPYSASKAASDHLVRAWLHTYGLPTVTTNCSNNYGPYQFPEKLMPLMIVHALEGKPLPVYGDGLNVRDWLYVADHCRAIRTVLDGGRIGETYNIGGDAEMTNLEVVNMICAVLDELRPRSDGRPYGDQIAFVADRPGHDRRYAINPTKIRTELGWKPSESFNSGIRKTVHWYLSHQDWVQSVTSGAYRDWIRLQRGEQS